ncbi:MAG: ImuA family protein [Candidatus Binataceae bacterium]
MRTFPANVVTAMTLGDSSSKSDRIATLRQTVARSKSASLGAVSAHIALGPPEVQRCLPSSGLSCGAIHEVVGAAHGDRAAAFGFVIALIACALGARRGPAVLVVSRRCLENSGELYGHGLCGLGLDVGRLVLVETQNEKDALWAIEESLRSEVASATIAGAIESNLDLAISRRLDLAATASGTPLILLRSPIAIGTSVSVTRWRVAAAPAARDRFGAFARYRWSVALERSRNGRVGQWTLEWDHVTHRFRLAEVVADHAPSQGAGQDGFRLAV